MLSYHYLLLALACVFFLLSLLITNTTAVTCYTCDSDTDKKCGDDYNDKPFNGTGMNKCTGKYCLKHKDGDSVSRMCHAVTDGEMECSKSANGKICICDKDLCNTAPYLAPTIAIVLSTLCFLVLLI